MTPSSSSLLCYVLYRTPLVLLRNYSMLSGQVRQAVLSLTHNFYPWTHIQLHFSRGFTLVSLFMFLPSSMTCLFMAWYEILLFLLSLNLTWATWATNETKCSFSLFLKPRLSLVLVLLSLPLHHHQRPPFALCLLFWHNFYSKEVQCSQWSKKEVT